MSTIVIKIGTNTLTTESRQLDLNIMRQLVSDISDVLKQGKHRVVLVSSGAITCGAQAMGITPESIPDKQASASVGQFLLMKHYAQFFAEFGFQVGQILLTKDGLDHPGRRLNAYNTLDTLLNRGIVPIINENDSVSIDEIQFGDNDQLSSQVACLIQADLLMMLSDIDGLYDKDPREHADAQKIQEVPKITDAIKALAAPHSRKNSKGGMPSKLLAAEIATAQGIPTIIAAGRTPHIVSDLIKGESKGTRFL